MKISMVIASLDCGGAERVTANLANEWAARGEKLSIITFEEKGTKPFYKLDSSIAIHQIECGRVGKNAFEKLAYNIKKILLLRKTLVGAAPDAVISFMGQTNVSSILALTGTRIPVIITEHIDNRMYSFGFVWDALARAVYPLAAALVAVSKGVLGSFPDYIRAKGTVIYNPIAINPGGAMPPRKHPAGKIIGMGRLTAQKGFDLLLEAFSLVSEKYPSWNVEIWGEGEDRAKLEALRDKLGLKARVRFAGVTDKPYERFADADIFVLPSRFEGLGIVLCEAMSQGLPAISFACPSGPAEIIRDNTDGLLVPPGNVQEFAAAMARLMSDEPLRRQLGARAAETRERFDVKNVIVSWDKLLAKLSGKNVNT